MSNCSAGRNFKKKGFRFKQALKITSLLYITSQQVKNMPLKVQKQNLLIANNN